VRERVRARALGVLFLPSPVHMCSLYVCVCVCMYACVRACVCACVHRKEATQEASWMQVSDPVITLLFDLYR